MREINLTGINPNLSAKDRIYKDLPDTLKILMNKYLLSPEEHAKILEDIKRVSYDKKTPVERPTYIIVLGQTGSGKSNLTSSIYAQEQNIVTIDSDKYKAFRSDNPEILKKHLVEYAFLTAPDSYQHRDEMIYDAMQKKYNILMECATTTKQGMFIDVNEIKNAGYDVELAILGVSSLNSLLSVHERYEAQIKANYPAPKLTGITRHDESFSSLSTVIKNVQNSDIKISVYRRAQSYPFFPEKVYTNTDKNPKFSCALDALTYTQFQDEKLTLTNFQERYNVILQQMQLRNAPQEQLEQLKEIKSRYNNIINQKDLSD